MVGIETDEYGRPLWAGRWYEKVDTKLPLRLICWFKGHNYKVANCQGPPDSYCSRCGCDLNFNLTSGLRRLWIRSGGK